MRLIIITNNPSGAQAEVQKALLRRLEDCLHSDEKKDGEESGVFVALPRHFELAKSAVTAHRGVIVLDVLHEKLVTSSPLEWMLEKKLAFKYANRIIPIDETFSVDGEDE